MGLFKMRTALLSLTAAAAMTLSVNADSYVDQAFDDNQNDFEYYWYYYDDNAGIGENDRPTAGTGTTPSVINVAKHDTTTDIGSVKYKHNAYTFVTGADASDGKAAYMPFTFGEKWKTSWDTKNAQEKSFVGLGTMLCANGKKIDLTGATAVKFDIRSGTNPLTVRFKIQTKEIDDISDVTDPAELDGDEFGYYGYPVDATTTWSTVTVSIDDLALPGTWAKAIDFNIASATKLAWEVQKASNTTVESDTLYIDNIQVVGYDYVSPSMWTKTVDIGAPGSGEFATFDKAPFNQTKFIVPTYWYAYNDAEIGGKSTVPETYAIYDEETKRLGVQFADGTGSGGSGQGCAVEYELGGPIDQDGVAVAGFIGIGCNTYDSVKAEYWDAKTAGAKNIYFEYTADGDVKCLTLEVSDINDVADGTKPDQKKSLRGSGVVRYRNFPNTGDKWVAVSIPLDSLIQHTDWAGSKEIALDQSKIAKLQWKVQGGEKSKGFFSVDNIYFDGVTKYGFGKVSVNMLKNTTQAANFNVAYLNGNINVSWKNAQPLSSGKVSLINARGAVVASKNIAKTSDLSANFSSKRLPAGMYFVTLNAVNTSGKAVTKQSPITLVK